MNANDFKDFIIPYLPISFEQKTRNYFIGYLLESLVSNWEKKKYQFSLLSANILFMTIIFRDFWFDVKYLNKRIELDKQLPLSYYRNAIDFFNLSKYNEKLFISSYLRSLDFDVNEIADIKKLVDNRDHCAHACGKIYYNDIKVGGFLEEYREAIQAIESKRRTSIIAMLYNFFVNNNKAVKEFIKDLLFVYSISMEECKGLICFCEKIATNNCKDTAHILLLVYFLKIINYEEEITDADERLLREVQTIITNNPDKQDELYELFESELSYETDNFNFNTISFEKMEKLFVPNKEETNSTQKIVDVDTLIGQIKSKNGDAFFLQSLQKLLNDTIGGNDD